MFMTNETEKKGEKNYKFGDIFGAKTTQTRIWTVPSRTQQLDDFHLQKCDKRYDTIRVTGKAYKQASYL